MLHGINVQCESLQSSAVQTMPSILGPTSCSPPLRYRPEATHLISSRLHLDFTYGSLFELAYQATICTHTRPSGTVLSCRQILQPLANFSTTLHQLQLLPSATNFSDIFKHQLQEQTLRQPLQNRTIPKVIQNREICSCSCFCRCHRHVVKPSLFHLPRWNTLRSLPAT